MNRNIKVVRVGTNTFLTPMDEVSDTLAPKTYALNFNEVENRYFLTARDPYELPPKVYGNPRKFVDRIMKTYHARGRGMGVLLSGDKGTGKTLLYKMLANVCGMPVIVVDEGYTGQTLTEFIQNLPCPCMFGLDEFEKRYSAGARAEADGSSPSEYLLSLLDGTLVTQHLFVLTSNEANVGKYFLGRPGRIRYHKEFHGLEQDMIVEMIEDNVKDPVMQAAIQETVAMITNISHDALMSIIEEVNIHGEAPKEFMSYFNVTSDMTTPFTVDYSFMSVGMLGDSYKNIPDDLLGNWNISEFLDVIKEYVAGSLDPKGGHGEILSATWIENIREFCATHNDELATLFHVCAPNLRWSHCSYGADWCRPFNNNVEDGSLTVYADYLYRNPSPSPRMWSGRNSSFNREYLTVSWARGEIKDMSTDNAGVITITSTRDHKLVCRPTRSRGGAGGRGL